MFESLLALICKLYNEGETYRADALATIAYQVLQTGYTKYVSSLSGTLSKDEVQQIAQLIKILNPISRNLLLVCSIVGKTSPSVNEWMDTGILASNQSSIESIMSGYGNKAVEVAKSNKTLLILAGLALGGLVLWRIRRS